MSIRFSIITITYQAVNYIDKTMKSVLSQSYEDFEYIIKDACSTDGTLEHIQRNLEANSSRTCNVKVISRKDSGIYEGMNQGIDASSGDYLIFLNAGDIFCNNEILEKISLYIEKNVNCHIPALVVGDWIMEGNIYVDVPDTLSWYFFHHSQLGHLGIFYSKKFFEIYGNYDESLRIVGDFESEVKAFYNHVLYYHYKGPIGIYDLSGISSQGKNQKLLKRERKLVIKRYFPFGCYFICNVKRIIYTSYLFGLFYNFIKKVKH